jgi:hypothetical protein
MATARYLPLVIPPNHPISTSLTHGLGPMPPTVPFQYASSPRTLFFRTAVSLASGRVSAYIHAREYGLPPDEPYEHVNRAVLEIIGMLDGGPAPDTWLNCASYPMLIW